MSYQPKDNTGSLFKNDKRESDTHPQARGSALIDGVEWWVDAWTNTTKDGKKYQSLKFKRKEQKQEARKYDAVRAGATKQQEDDFDSDPIPF